MADVIRETEYVELAFWAGFVDALGRCLNHTELCDMAERLRPVVADMAATYLSEGEV